MRDGVEAGGRTGVSWDENQLAILWAGGRPLEVVLAANGLVVVIDTKQRHVQVVPWEVEVVRVAAKEGDSKLRSENQPNIRELPVPVKIILPTLVQSDDIAAQSGCRERLLLDRNHLGAPGTQRFRGTHIWFCCSNDSGSDVFDADQLIELEVRSLRLFVPGWSIETCLQIVGLRGADLLQRVGRNMMIGQNEPVGRN